MAVVKNMIVRVGADMSGLVSGFKRGGASTRAFAKMAAAEIKTLASEVAGMESAYAAITKATERMNLGTPVSKQIAALEKDKSKLMAEAEKAAASVAYWAEIEPIGSQFKTEEASQDLEKLDIQIRNVTARIKELQDVADLGNELGLGDVSAKTLAELRKSISDARTKMIRLSEATSRSNVDVGKLLTSFRRMGIVTMGLRFMRSIFGELGTVVRQYISENETLQAQVNSLKSAMGQALAPAINIVTNALAVLMPYVVGVSNAIGSLLSALGGGWATVAAEANGAAKAIKGAGGAQKDLNRSLQGFDEITKLNGKSGGGGGGSSSGSTVKIEPITPQWVQEFIDDLIVEIQEQDWAGVGTVVVQGLSRGIGAAGGLVAKVGVKLFTPIKENFNKNVDKWVENGAPTQGAAVGAAIVEGICQPFIDAPSWIRENIWIPLTYGFDSVFYGKEVAELKLGVKDDTETWWRKVQSFARKNPSPDLPITATVQDDSTIWWKIVWDAWKKKKDEKGDVEPFTVKVKNNAASWWQNVKDWWAEKVSKVSDFTTGVKNDASTWWSNVKTWWKDKIDKLSFAVAVKNDAASWWDNVKLWWKNAVGTLTAKLDIKLPKITIEWGTTTAFGKEFKYPKGFDIQWNAKGLIMSGAQIFGRAGNTFLGGAEAGREALLPLDRHTWWMDDIADRVALRVTGGGGGDQSITVNLVLDGKIVTSTVVRNINAQARATGRNPLAAHM